MSDRRCLWTDQALTELTRMAREGLSAREIGKAMSLTRNAVISKISRTVGLKLKTPRPGSGGPRALPPKPRPVAKPHAKPRKAPAAVADGHRLFCEPITLLDLKPASCRFPVDGDDGEILFCGGQRDGDRPYCLAHSGVCFLPPRETGSRWARGLRKYVDR